MRIKKAKAPDSSAIHYAIKKKKPSTRQWECLSKPYRRYLIISPDMSNQVSQPLQICYLVDSQNVGQSPFFASRL
jgi:hypothetical protein